MKTVILKIEGAPADGDLAVVAYTHPQRGGMSYATYTVRGEKRVAELVGDEAQVRVVTGDTPESIAKGLASSINDQKGEFCSGQFNATATGDMLVIACSDSVDDVRFITQFQGKGSGMISQLG